MDKKNDEKMTIRARDWKEHKVFGSKIILFGASRQKTENLMTKQSPKESVYEL
jgi:hypothetical protein